jgi:hypothetical protein
MLARGASPALLGVAEALATFGYSIRRLKFIGRLRGTSEPPGSVLIRKNSTTGTGIGVSNGFKKSVN